MKEGGYLFAREERRDNDGDGRVEASGSVSNILFLDLDEDPIIVHFVLIK